MNYQKTSEVSKYVMCADDKLYLLQSYLNIYLKYVEHHLLVFICITANRKIYSFI